MFLIDMHVHTDQFFRRGPDAVKEMVRLYKKAGISCIVSTDHMSPRRARDNQDYLRDFWEAYNAVRHEAGPEGIRVERGAEIKVCGAHLLVYGLDEADFRVLKMDGHVNDLVESVHKQGGLVFQAHPAYMKHGRYAHDIFTGVDGYEIRNGTKCPTGDPVINAMCSGMGKLICAGSDAHKLRHIGGACLQSQLLVTDRTGLVEILKNRGMVS